MASALNLRDTVRDLWATWTLTANVYENEKYTPTTGVPFCRLVIREGQSQIISLGRPSLDRHTGLIYIQIYVPVGEGDERVRWYADQARVLFRKITVAGITFKLPYDNVAGDTGEGWWLMNVIVPYILDEVT